MSDAAIIPFPLSGKERDSGIKKKVHEAADPPHGLSNIVTDMTVPKFALRLLNDRSFVAVKPNQTSYSCARQRCFAFKCGRQPLARDGGK